jgi:hypothetical protein
MSPSWQTGHNLRQEKAVNKNVTSNIKFRGTGKQHRERKNLLLNFLYLRTRPIVPSTADATQYYYSITAHAIIKWNEPFAIST